MGGSIRGVGIDSMGSGGVHMSRDTEEGDWHRTSLVERQLYKVISCGIHII